LPASLLGRGQKKSYEKYLKCGQAAFLRFDAMHGEERRDEHLTQDTDDLARALGVINPTST
jgi:hypothetical protein